MKLKSILAAITAFASVLAFSTTASYAENEHLGARFHHGGGYNKYGHQYYGKRHFNNNYGHRRSNSYGYRGHNYGYNRYNYGHHRRGHNGAAIAAGILGLTSAAIIASQVHKHNKYKKRSYNRPVSHGSIRPYSAEWYAACARKYRSFNPETGHYLSYSGKYRLCKI